MSNMYPNQYAPQHPPRKKTGRILVIVGVALVTVIGLLFAGCSALVSEINGGGGGHTAKAAEMMAAADRAPESDWEFRNRTDPKVEDGCLSIDTHCLKLRASWNVDHVVDSYEVGERMELDQGEFEQSSRSANCITVAPRDGNSRTEICVSDSDEQPGSYQVDIFMTRK